MANKSGKKLAPTKKEWEQSASRLAGGMGGAVLIPPVPLIQEDSGSFRGPQLHRSPFLFGSFLFLWSQKDGEAAHSTSSAEKRPLVRGNIKSKNIGT